MANASAGEATKFSWGYALQRTFATENNPIPSKHPNQNIEPRSCNLTPIFKTVTKPKSKANTASTIDTVAYVQGNAT
jgi:hypothetical protein